MEFGRLNLEERPGPTAELLVKTLLDEDVEDPGKLSREGTDDDSDDAGVDEVEARTVIVFELLMMSDIRSVGFDDCFFFDEDDSKMLLNVYFVKNH